MIKITKIENKENKNKIESLKELEMLIKKVVERREQIIKELENELNKWSTITAPLKDVLKNKYYIIEKDEATIYFICTGNTTILKGSPEGFTPTFCEGRIYSVENSQLTLEEAQGLLKGVKNAYFTLQTVLEKNLKAE